LLVTSDYITTPEAAWGELSIENLSAAVASRRQVMEQWTVGGDIGLRD